MQKMPETQVRKIFHPRSGRSPGEGNGNPLPYSCLENPMDSEAWWATVHEITESDTTQGLILYFFSCKGLRNIHADKHSINRGKYSNLSHTHTHTQNMILAP